MSLPSSFVNSVDDDDNNNNNNNNNNETNTNTNEEEMIQYGVSNRLRWELVWKRGHKEKKIKLLQEYCNISNFIDESSNSNSNNNNNVLSLCKLKSFKSVVSSATISILAANTGNNVRIYINDIPAPSYYIWRTPSFGIILESCWVLYTSFKLPLKGECYYLENLLWTIETDMYRIKSQYPYPCPYPFPL